MSYCCDGCVDWFEQNKERWKENDIKTKNGKLNLILHHGCNFEGLPEDLKEEYLKLRVHISTKKEEEKEEKTKLAKKETPNKRSLQRKVQPPNTQSKSEAFITNRQRNTSVKIPKNETPKPKKKQKSKTNAKNSFTVVVKRKKRKELSMTNIKGTRTTKGTGEQRNNKPTKKRTPQKVVERTDRTDRTNRTDKTHRTERTNRTDGIECTRCGKKGHESDRCGTNKRSVWCYRCGDSGHLARVCNTKMCDNCKKRGHTSESCRTDYCDDCEKFGHSTDGCWNNNECERCLQTGHPTDKCKSRKWCTLCFNIYKRDYDKTVLEDRMKFNELCSHYYGECERRKLVCNKCSDVGHTEEECKSKVCDFCGKRGHSTGKCFYKMWCNLCQKFGHPYQRCRSKKFCYFCFRTKKFEFKDREDPKLLEMCDHYPGLCEELRHIDCRFCGGRGHDEPFCNSEYKPR